MAAVVAAPAGADDAELPLTATSHRSGATRSQSKRAKARLHGSALCASGLDALLIAEMDAMGIRGRSAKPGTVHFEATARQLYLLNAGSRIANRVLVRTRPFTAHNFDELDRGIGGIDWTDWLVAGEPVRFRVKSSSSRLFHSGAIEERLQARVADVAGVAPPVSNTESVQNVMVQATRDQFTVSVDASGDDLHRRGWRQEVGKAPLRETLAAAMLAASGWDGTSALIDPFCGSGTVPIEAALIAKGVAPGLGRRFAFQDWPSFEPGTWASVTAGLQQAIRDRSVPIVGRDRDQGAIAAAMANAERAGVADDVDLAMAPVSEMATPMGVADVNPTGLVVCNPPWGSRLEGSGDLRNLAARLGERVRSLDGNWDLGVLVADTDFRRHLGMPTTERFRTTAGGTRVRYVASGSGSDSPAP